MAKTVLLARPHPFIVSEMRPFLEQNGFVPKKLESLAALPTSVAGASGTIISLAVASSVGIVESAEEVFAAVRKQSPPLPVLFAAMLDFAKMKSTLERLAKNNGIDAIILGIDAATESNAGLSKPNTFLYIGKDDLVSPEKRAIAARILQRHFR